MNEIEIIRFIQSFANPVLDVIFTAATMLGSEDFFMIVLGGIYWCLDKRSGYALTLLVTGTYWINTFLKEVFHTPRPSPEVVRVLYPESSSGFAFPSGRTQSALVFWGALPRYFGARWLVTAGLIIVPLVALSRLYLGLHWPIDIAGGAFFGAITLLLVPCLTRAGEAWARRTSLVIKVLAALLLPLAGFAAYGSLDNAKMAGVITGFLLGAMAEARFVGFSERGPVMRQAQKYLLGATVVMLVRVGLKVLVGGSVFAAYIRYTIIGVTGTLVVPVLFVALGLSSSNRRLHV